MSEPLIFITGATGFIGSHVVSQALHAGYKVRLSVRKEAQIDSLRTLFSEHAAQLDFSIITDFTSPDAFNKALQGATYVFHLASPMPGNGPDFEADYLNPAVQGTIALLDTAKNFATINRIVIVSSGLALVPLEAFVAGKFVVKEGLNPSIPVDPKMSFPDDLRSSGSLKYHASKILAHRATLTWASTAQPSFTIVTLHPSFAFGPSLTQTSAAALDGTNAILWGCLTSPAPLIPLAAVDVRDVASAHLKALEIGVSESNGVEEFIISAGEREGWTWERVVEFVRERHPSVNVKLEGPFEEPPKVDSQKAENMLGLKWKGMEDTVGSFLEQQAELSSQS